jgi:3-oxoacyl-[acyl-carrier-protein] synthase II
MHIAGIGVVFNRGRGVGSLFRSDSTSRIDPELLKDKDVLKEARRADDFTKCAVLAAHDAFVDSGLGLKDKESLGIIVASGFGPHVTTFRFLDDILTYGDKQVSPTLFSHSVHNAAASYIASNLKTRGPTLTVTQFADSFHQALIIAQSWLQEKRCAHILVGSVEQMGKEMEYILSNKAKDMMPVEGSFFFLVTEKVGPKKYCLSLDLMNPEKKLSGLSLSLQALEVGH